MTPRPPRSTPLYSSAASDVYKRQDTFQYSATGELVQVVMGGQTITYAYDGMRRRTARTDVNGTAQYLYGNPENALQVTHARSAAGILTTYYYDEGRRLYALQRGANRY